MTRSNIFVTLTGGKKLFFVLDSSTAPEQGYIVEKFILPLLALNDQDKEIAFIHKNSDSINEKRTTASYRYIIDLQQKRVQFFVEHYNYKTDRFRRGKDLTEKRYLPYLRSVNQSTII
ncbi:hypothetical protein A3860_17350 [Niastella vici]|uniref:Uncharacterized protein n=1 Tax=Niastella vici TaxID=1703345 RepID=A0A1V9G4D8_9BACT|nr:hypothetical protein [Niastella vici]OQP65430.1 hypothetical protein A3860_17350 [Niastella vici]